MKLGIAMTNFQTTQSEIPPDVIDLGIGHPAPELLPLALLREAAALRLGQGDAGLLQYGFEQGDGYFRRALADFLTAEYGRSVSPDGLFVTAGASQALDLICTLYTRPGDVVFVEEPSYFLALRIFADHRLQVVGVPADADGLRIDILEESLRDRRPAFLYTIPTHQNPAGFTLPLHRRTRLVELAQQHGFLVVADEVYHLLSYGAAPPSPLAAWAETGVVLGLGSFSKILAPGLRLGWVQAAPDHVRRLVTSGLLDSGGGLNPFTSGLVRVALEQGWQTEHLARLRGVYRQRVAAMDMALRAVFGSAVDWRTPGGGYFFWVTLPDGMDASALTNLAATYKVGFRPGTRFSGAGGLQNCVRLSFAYYDDDQLTAGVRRLGQVVAEAALQEQAGP
jgi:DNA-binding transcriptional MocR family regulator